MKIVSKAQGSNNIESNMAEQTEVLWTKRCGLKILPPHVARSVTLDQCVSLSINGKNHT